jgi:DNA-binding MarR family transcriptional regulator
VERRGDPENLRVTYAILTEGGREALERARPAFGEEIEERFAGHLSDEEIRTVRRAMRNVIRASGEEPLSEGTND